jgi:hypothetical protein
MDGFPVGAVGAVGAVVQVSFLRNGCLRDLDIEVDA